MYYPKRTLKIDQTRFGMPKTAPISLYQMPIPGKVILKIDLLDVLRQKWGDNMMQGREYAYKLVSGEGVNDNQYRYILTSCYKRFAAFANYCDECYYFGDYHKSLHARFLAPVKEMIQNRRDELCALGRFLAEDSGYIYLGFNPDKVPTDIQGVVAKYA